MNSNGQGLSRASDVPDDPLARFLQEITRVKDDQRLLILVSHGVLELFVNALVDAKCKNSKRITSDSRGYPHSARLIILNEIGVISDPQFEMYDWFRKLRNRAAHDPVFELRPEDLERLPEDHRNPARLERVCVSIVGGFWNAHIPELVGQFMPSLAGAVAAEHPEAIALPNKRLQPTAPAKRKRCG